MLLVINIAGLSDKLLQSGRAPRLQAFASSGRKCAIKPVFPAVTCTAQATYLTGTTPDKHGIVANGWLDRASLKLMFWEHSAGLVEAPFLWTELRNTRPDLKVANLFWWNSLGSGADVILNVAPIHKHHGGMMSSCYSRPSGLNAAIEAEQGSFPIHRYWGPMTSIASTAWIAGATIHVMRNHQCDIMLTYLSHLDYNLQRLGPDAPKVLDDLAELDSEAGRLLDEAQKLGAKVIVLSEYAIELVDGAVEINRTLKRAGLLRVREVGGMEYPDFVESGAFAITDHQVAHVYTAEGGAKYAIDVLEPLEGVDKVFARAESPWPIDHRRAGDVIAVAKKGRWFSYGWWDEPSRAPDYATHIDIHNKPGFDPLELFAKHALWPFAIARDLGLVRGSHGRVPLEGDPHPVLLTDFTDELPGTLSATDVAGLIRRAAAC
jgi:predicted AlkP superfamily pyrophosphatase or phosphodiesterase